MLNVVVLNWRNYLGLGSLYVNRMFSMTHRHLTLPHEFIEVTERDLHHTRAGWFNKLELLEMFDDETLYIDLDCVISSNINHIVEHACAAPALIWARDDWSYPVTNPQWGREATINSSVLIWNGRQDMRGVTQKMLDDTHGDQGILTQLFWPDGIALLPNDSVKSYKYDYLQGKGFGPITAFHGEPKPHELPNDSLIRTHWR